MRRFFAKHDTILLRHTIFMYLMMTFRALLYNFAHAKVCTGEVKESHKINILKDNNNLNTQEA